MPNSDSSPNSSHSLGRTLCFPIPVRARNHPQSSHSPASSSSTFYSTILPNTCNYYLVYHLEIECFGPGPQPHKPSLFLCPPAHLGRMRRKHLGFLQNLRLDLHLRFEGTEILRLLFLGQRCRCRPGSAL